MTAEQILKELEELANRSGITIRYEKGDFDGGFCVLKAERLIVVNRKLATAKKGSVVAQAIAEVGVEEVYLKPAVREFIEEELSRAAQEAVRAASIAVAAHQQIVAETSHLAVEASPPSTELTVEAETADGTTANAIQENGPPENPGSAVSPERLE